MHDMASSKSSSVIRLKQVYPATLNSDSVPSLLTVSKKASCYFESMQNGSQGFGHTGDKIE